MSKAEMKNNRELAELLPWYVNGTLDAATMQAIDRALETDGELRNNLDRAREDQAAALELAEADSVPLSMPARFEAQLDREISVSQQQAATANAGSQPSLLAGLGEWLQETLLGGSRPRLAFAAIAAAVVILLQSGAIVSMFVSGGSNGPGMGLASGEKPEGAPAFVFLVQIGQNVTLSDLGAFLEANGGRIVDGPLAGGMYRLGFDEKEGRSAETVLNEMASRSDLFALVLPGT